MTACTSTGRPWSCALATALPGVLTDSARLGSARHTVRRSAAQTRRGEMRRGRLPSHDYRTTDPSVAARALRLVRERLRPTSYTYASCRFHGGLGLLFSPFLSSFFFILSLFVFFTLFFTLLSETCRISSATRRVPRVNKRSDSLVSRTTPPILFSLSSKATNRATIGYCPFLLIG